MTHPTREALDAARQTMFGEEAPLWVRNGKGGREISEWLERILTAAYAIDFPALPHQQEGCLCGHGTMACPLHALKRLAPYQQEGEQTNHEEILKRALDEVVDAIECHALVGTPEPIMEAASSGRAVLQALEQEGGRP